MRKAVNEMLTVNCPCCGKELDIVPEGDYHEITCDDCHLSMWQHKAEEIISVCNQKQAELDRLKAELTNLANTGITPLDGTWAGGWASAMSHVMEIVDNWTPGKAGDNK